MILGNTVNPDGSLSGRLKSRLDKGLQLFRDSVAERIFVSGGYGKEGYYEGRRMAEYLIAKGIPATTISIDNQGNNTHTTAVNFIQKFGNTSSVVVVSQYTHISRAKLAFWQCGLKQVGNAHCQFFEWRDLYSLIREFFGYYKYLIWY